MPPAARPFVLAALLAAAWPGGIYVSPFPHPFNMKMTEEQASQYALKQLEYLLASQTAPRDTAAILIESVLGEAVTSSRLLPS